MKRWLLKLHRWIALAFALPLAAVVLSGALLAVEPWLVSASSTPGSLDAERIGRLLREHDPEGRARSIAHRSYDGTMTISFGREGSTVVDVATGARVAAPSMLSGALRTARRLHETLLWDAGWLVEASTVAMLVLTLLGVAMGWPRLSNTLWGWHAALAWLPLPLVVLSPLTGLLLAYGVSLAPPLPRPAGTGAPTLEAAVRTLGAGHDLSGLVWLRPQGGRMLARIVEDGEYRVYAIGQGDVVVAPRNWPRLWHEGTFAGTWSSLLNLAAAFAMFGLVLTGPWLWWRRLRRRRRVAPPTAA